MNYEHEVPTTVRRASRWNDEYACYTAPDGRNWRYTDDPDCRGSSVRDGFGVPVRVSVWLTDDGREAVEACQYQASR